MADEDGWVGLTWNTPLMYDQNFALAGFDRPHVFQMGFVYTLPFAGGFDRRWPAAWRRAGRSTASSPPTRARRSRWPAPTPPSTARAAARSYHQLQRRRVADGRRRDQRPAVVPASPASRSRPGANVAGFGNTLRNFFRRPGVWNVDLSVFKTMQIGRWRPEFRLEMANVFNHTTWGRPVVTFTANNFMQFMPQSTVVRRHQPAEHSRVAPDTDRAAHAVLIRPHRYVPPGPLRHRVAAARLSRQFPPRSSAPTPPRQRRPATARGRGGDVVPPVGRDCGATHVLG